MLRRSKVSAQETAALAGRSSTGLSLAAQFLNEIGFHGIALLT